MGNIVAISGASGRTGFRIAEEALARGGAVRLLVRPTSKLPPSLAHCDVRRLDFGRLPQLVEALAGCHSQVIATGARPSANLLGPFQVDAQGVQRQVQACQQAGVGRVVLVSSLCSGRFRHNLNLFGLILVCKRWGEEALEQSGLDWTVVRPGGLKEGEADLEQQELVVSGANTQQQGVIPRRLVARYCLECLDNPGAIRQVLEITSKPRPAA
ncbi:MAG: SDR family oxidoreductase [Synechococcus sp. SB0673_bin_10]|nr:SDR family oxidoreductase [Synechococcus sp. SB0667_bin_8]MYG63475.1 SDR family oxidoreductase [Synechococcus sp. SB0675_bin_7]MYI72392.1 SDR family oxidoreductase [Synechococcus sp. SB0673_bin_10]MYK85959.1 SDR family oxidoreductase [Synechococcus sp. SB0669_bin_7]